MPKQTTAFDLAAITLDAQSGRALYQQVHDGLRDAVLSGRLAGGARLPSTRELCAELNLSRNTVVAAFEQLIAEGYLESRTGDGTYVSRSLPDDMLHVRHGVGKHRSQQIALPAKLSKSAQTIQRAGRWLNEGPPRAFRPDVLALDEFPIALWSRLVARRWRNATVSQLDYGDPAGYGPLREAIAGYLGAARGVRCSAEQVMIVSGSQQGIDLAARVLLNAGDPVWVEDPGYRGAKAALSASGAQLVPVPVDEDGLCVDAGESASPKARMAYVTPSHQYPTGVTMSLPRRLALLDWAKRADAWIVEDDYDSEYRYAGRPLPALQGLDVAGRVIYVGTFSKVLFPALRLGYAVLPDALVDAFVRMQTLVNRQMPALDQAIVADFIVEGHFARHIRRMRALYAGRQDALVRAVQRELGGVLDIQSAEAGLHVVGWLPPGMDDARVAQAALKRGIEAPPLSRYAMTALPRGGLMLGFAGLNERQIRDGVRQLRGAFE
jgi:GntR family transcriptional regulator/MocR family aminotransferase